MACGCEVPTCPTPQAFGLMDKDGSGAIGVQEIHEALGLLSIHMSRYVGG